MTKAFEDKLLSGLTSGLPTHFSRDGETYLHPQFRDFLNEGIKEEVKKERQRCASIVKVHESPHTSANCRLCKIETGA